MLKEKKREIISYLYQYYQKICDFLVSNPELQPSIPDNFKWRYHHLFRRCIDGIAVASYPVMLNDYIFRIDSEKSVSEITRCSP
jgi:hypothetical protein